VHIAIVFDSASSTTASAARKMAETVRAAGHDCSVASVEEADPRSVTRADALAIGCWTRGWLIVRQRPSEGALAFVERLSLKGKPVAVFATYRLAIGHTLRALAGAVEASGGKVTGMYQARGGNAPPDFQAWVASLEREAAFR
jgi:flavodoxin